MKTEQFPSAEHAIADERALERIVWSLKTQNRALEMMLQKAPLHDVLSLLVETVEAQSGGEAIASILLLDEEDRLRRGASPSLPEDYQQAIDGLQIAPDLGTCAAAAATGRVVITTDFSTDPGWAEIRHLPLDIGLVAAWSMPIKARDGSVLGTFGTYFRERRAPTPEEMHSVQILVQTAALAIEQERRVTALQINAERQAFQLALADRLRPLTRAEDIIATATELLGRHLNISRVMYADIDDAGGTFFIRHDWLNQGVSSITGQVRQLDDFGPEIIASLRRAEPMVVNDIALDPRTVPHAQAYAQIGVRANLAIPFVKSGQLTIVLTLHHVLPRFWKPHEVELVCDTAERTWSAAENARAQVQLRQERDQSRYIFDTMNEGFVLMSEDATLLYINEAASRISQKSPGTLLGKNHWDVFPELAGTAVEDLYRQVQAEGNPGSIEYLHAYPSGQAAWIAIRAYPSLAGRLAVFFSDITERKHVELELQEASRRKDEFIAMLGHELRNPLSPISAAAELLQFVKHDEHRVMQASEVIARQVNHMTSLVDDLLDVSRVTRGLVRLDMERVDLRRCVYDAVEQAGSLIQAGRHHLTLHLEPESTWVMGDPNRLVQVIANLLNNAAKYTPEGGNIVLETLVRDGQVVLHVSDNGIGMEKDFVTQVFGLFTQASRTSDRSHGGLGLGLALVKSLVELHGGSVTCESKGLGKGSRFTICLPHLATQNEEPQYHEAGTEKGDRPLRIMLVDDNVDAAAMLAMLLESSGHEVLVEHVPHRALERAQREKPDVCLLDIGLPGMDGNELALCLRKLPETQKALLIAITGYGQDRDRQHAQESGFDHYLTKPVDTRKLSGLLVPPDASSWRIQ